MRADDSQLRPLHLLRDPLPEARDRPALRVVGVGNAWRGDDAAGLAVARRLRELLPDEVEILEREGEPTSLIDSWESARAAWVVDAVSSGVAPGSVHRFDATEEQLPDTFGATSTHHFGLSEAIELARAVGRLPGRLVVYGVEGLDFGVGDSLTSAVEAAVERVARAISAEIVDFG